MNNVFDLNYFRNGLKLLSMKMEENNLEPLNLYTIGGFCMMVHGYRGATKDIDSYFDLSPALNKLIIEVGREIHNPEWLNNDVHISNKYIIDMPSLIDLLSVDDSFTLWESYGRIKVYISTDVTLLYTKLIAFRDEGAHSDMDDIALILNKSGFSVEQLISKLKKFKSFCHDFDNILFNLLLVAYKYDIIDDKEYERLYINLV